MLAAFRNLPIRQKLALGIVGTSVTALLLAFVVLITFEWVTSRHRTASELQSLAGVIGANSTGALSFNDASAATETLAALRARPQILSACIYAKGNNAMPGVFASYRKDAAQADCPTTAPAEGMVLTQDLLMVATPVKLDDQSIGILYIERSLSDVWRTIGLYLILLLGLLLACLLVAFAMSTLLQRIIAVPIVDLARVASRVSETKDYSLRAPGHGSDEVGRLIEGFNDMLGQIDQRDQALETAQTELVTRMEETARANVELQTALTRLQITQDQLVQTEKMASLGALVAGIAHEINTPVGVGVTAASTLGANAATLRSEYEAGTLTKSGLMKFTDMAVQATDIILTNLNRASELIQSFKQVAVDQSSSERRRFKVNAYIHEILMSLRPKLKKTRLRVEVNCDESLEINTYPGALSQVLTNLVMNSLIHAYDEGASGLLSIDVEQRDGWLRLSYSDDGRGIPSENLSRVFDPFFTTRRGSGGSGLGMHIVYNLVTQQLGGTVKLKSEVGKGTSVEIVMPSSGAIVHEQPTRRHG